MKQFNNCVIAKKHGRLSILIVNKCNINHDKLKCSVPLCSTTIVKKSCICRIFYLLSHINPTKIAIRTIVSAKDLPMLSVLFIYLLEKLSYTTLQDTSLLLG